MKKNEVGILYRKQKLRTEILRKLKMQKEEERQRKSKEIKEKLFRSPVFKKAKKVMFYVALGGEVDTAEMIREAQKLGRTVAVPVCGKDRMLYPCLVDEGTEFVRGAYGTAQPLRKRYLSVEDLDLVLVPGVAFDKKGRRLGRGQGFYDRFLSRLPDRTVSIGLAFAFQVLPFIPSTRHDVGVKRIIFA